eukprot:3430387-Prymnesium_polylepis.1
MRGDAGRDAGTPERRYKVGVAERHAACVLPSLSAAHAHGAPCLPAPAFPRRSVRPAAGFDACTSLLSHETIRLWAWIPAERERSRPKVV